MSLSDQAWPTPPGSSPSLEELHKPKPQLFNFTRQAYVSVVFWSTSCVFEGTNGWFQSVFGRERILTSNGMTVLYTVKTL